MVGATSLLTTDARLARAPGVQRDIALLRPTRPSSPQRLR